MGVSILDFARTAWIYYGRCRSPGSAPWILGGRQWTGQAEVAQRKRKLFVIARLGVRLPPSAPCTGFPGGVGERLIPPGCKPGALTGYAGSNPAPATSQRQQPT